MNIFYSKTLAAVLTWKARYLERANLLGFSYHRFNLYYCHKNFGGDEYVKERWQGDLFLLVSGPTYTCPESTVCLGRLHSAGMACLLCTIWDERTIRAPDTLLSTLTHLIPWNSHITLWGGFLFVPAPRMWTCRHQEMNNLPKVTQLVDLVAFEPSMSEHKAVCLAAMQRDNVISWCDTYLGSEEAKKLTK